MDQNLKSLEDLQDEYDFKLNTLKNRGKGVQNPLIIEKKKTKSK